MPSRLVPVELRVLLARLDCEKQQLAGVLGVSRRALSRYLKTGQAPASVARAADLIHSAPPAQIRRLAPPAGPRRHQLLRFGDAYAVNALADLAREAYREAGLSLGEANARIAKRASAQQLAAVAEAAARNAGRRIHHAAYMRAQRALGKYRRKAPN